MLPACSLQAAVPLRSTKSSSQESRQQIISQASVGVSVAGSAFRAPQHPQLPGAVELTGKRMEIFFGKYKKNSAVIAALRAAKSLNAALSAAMQSLTVKYRRTCLQVRGK